MSNNPIHVRVEPHIHDMIDDEVRALGIKGGRGLAGGKAEWTRRIIYEHFDQPLPKQSHYLPSARVSGGGGQAGKQVSKQARPMKRQGPPQPNSPKPVNRAATLTIIDDPAPATVAPINPAPTPDDVPGQQLITGGEATRNLSDPATAVSVARFIVMAWDGRKASQWVQVPELLRRQFGTDFGLSDLACRARYRRAKAAAEKMSK